jgi:hypothetical protein
MVLASLLPCFLASLLRAQLNWIFALIRCAGFIPRAASCLATLLSNNRTLLDLFINERE